MNEWLKGSTLKHKEGKESYLDDDGATLHNSTKKKLPLRKKHTYSKEYLTV